MFAWWVTWYLIRMAQQSPPPSSTPTHHYLTKWSQMAVFCVPVTTVSVQSNWSAHVWCPTDAFGDGHPDRMRLKGSYTSTAKVILSFSNFALPLTHSLKLLKQCCCCCELWRCGTLSRLKKNCMLPGLCSTFWKLSTWPCDRLSSTCLNKSDPADGLLPVFKLLSKQEVGSGGCCLAVVLAQHTFMISHQDILIVCACRLLHE